MVTKIAPLLARVHALEVPVSKEPQVMHRARAWLDKVRHCCKGACTGKGRENEECFSGHRWRQAKQA